MTSIVVDLGCADRGEWFSLEALAEKYRPDILYGFDPSPSLNLRRKKIGGVPVKLERKAAWIHDGTITFDDERIHGRALRIGVGPSNPSLGRIGTIGTGSTVADCFDFSAWLAEHGPAIVKMDIEGAEYALLAKLLADNTARLMSELIIEWHDTPDVGLVDHLEAHGVTIKDWWM
jgi:FkbM family methyltransferase